VNQETAIQEQLAGPKPVAARISTHDIQMLYACHTSPDAFLQLILAKLKDAGAPVEGVLRLRLAHGKVFKVKTDPMVEQDAFEYLWLPEAYAEAMNMRSGGVC